MKLKNGDYRGPLLKIFSYHFSQFIKLYTFLYILDQPNYIGRGVISDVQLSCTETRFQKGSLSGKNGSKTQCYQYLWLAM